MVYYYHQHLVTWKNILDMEVLARLHILSPVARTFL